MAQTQQPKRGGTLRFAIGDTSENGSLDPAVAANGAPRWLCPLVYETLVRRDDHFKLAPAIAESWEHNATATEWTFHLRRGVRFHDGSSFTARDVAYTFRRLLKAKVGSPMRGRLALSFNADGLQIPDDHTLVIKMRRADALLPQALTRIYSGIVKDGSTPGREVSSAMGTGPFRVSSFKPGQSFSVARFNDYWVTGLPYLDGIQCVAIPDQTAKVQAVVSGAVDMTDGVDPVIAKRLSQNRAVRVARLPNAQYEAIFISQNVKPFDDVRVRKAIKLAMDRKLILETVYQELGTTTPDCPVPMTDELFPKELGVGPQDIAGARKLLAEAGYADGIQFEVFTSPVRAGFVDLAVTLAESVKPAGIRIKVTQWAAATYWDQVWRKRPAYCDYITRRPAYEALEVAFAKGGPFNGSHFDEDGRLRAQMDAALGEPDKNKRDDMLEKALVRVSEDSGALIPVFTDRVAILSTRVGGNPFAYEDPVSLILLWKSA